MKYEGEVTKAMEEGQITGEMAEKLYKKKRVEIYEDDDEETRAYKLKLNALAMEQKDVERHHKQVHAKVEVPSASDDRKCICLAGMFLGGYYATCIWMLLEGGGLALLAISLGVGAPAMLIWLVCSWRKAKKEGKRAIFKW